MFELCPCVRTHETAGASLSNKLNSFFNVLFYLYDSIIDIKSSPSCSTDPFQQFITVGKAIPYTWLWRVRVHYTCPVHETEAVCRCAID